VDNIRRSGASLDAPCSIPKTRIRGSKRPFQAFWKVGGFLWETAENGSLSL